MDFPVTVKNRNRLWALDRAAYGARAGRRRHYFAKDSVLRARDVEQAYGRARLDQFLAVSGARDPNGVLTSDLWTRALAPRR